MTTTTTPCKTCALSGPACGVGPERAPERGACVCCGHPTTVLSACGVLRHPNCHASKAAVRMRAQFQREPNVPPQAYARPTTGRVQPALRDALTGRLAAADVSRAIELWNANMRGIEWRGGHTTALGILNGTLKHASIPPLPPFDTSTLEILGPAPKYPNRLKALAWNVDANAPADYGYDLTGWDVNGMYHSAAAIELGTGDPELIEWPSDDVLKLPGYVRVPVLESAPWSIGDRFKEDSWIPTPMAAYLRDTYEAEKAGGPTGAQFLISQALVWPKHRRVLDPHVDLLRRARAELHALARHPETDEVIDQAAEAILRAVKDVTVRLFGGLLASRKHNRGSDTMRPDWKHQIVATGQARMFRALDRTKLREPGFPAKVVGIHVDSVWCVLPEGWETPPQLVISRQLGKFKAAGRTPWTPELYAAWAHGRHEPLRAALDATEYEPSPEVPADGDEAGEA